MVRLRMKRPSEKRALLCALTYSAGSITLGRGAMGIQYVTEHGQVGELIARLSGSCIKWKRISGKPVPPAACVQHVGAP